MVTISERVSWLVYILAGWCGILIIRALDFGGIYYPVREETWIVVLLWITMYVLGYCIFAFSRPTHLPRYERPSRRWFARWICGLCVLTVLGAAMLIYEFAFVRGYGFNTPLPLIRIYEVSRVMSGELSSSLISGIGRLLTPALIVAWLLSMICPYRLSRFVWCVLLAASAFALWQQMMFEGGRFFIAIVILVCFVAHRMREIIPGIRRKKGLRLHIVIPVVGAALVGFGYMFIARISSSSTTSYIDAYTVFISSFQMAADPAAMERLEGPGARLWFVAYMFWVYLSHGLNELNKLLSVDGLQHAFGLVQFPQVGQALSKLLGLPINYNEYANLPNVGTYTTIVGSNYVDFGIPLIWFMALLLGYFTARNAHLLSRSRFSSMGLTAPLLIVVGLFSPVVSIVINVWPAFVWAWFVGNTAHGLTRAAASYEQDAIAVDSH